MTGWLDDIPEIDLPASGKRKQKKRPPPPCPESPIRHDVVLYHVIHCPKCGGDNVPVVTTRRPIRYHKCKKCGYCFKSVEK